MTPELEKVLADHEREMAERAALVARMWDKSDRELLIATMLFDEQHHPEPVREIVG